jgi:hypothetical protein
MLLPGSYANGFAPRDGRPLYPELWRGCVGAWNPGLGVSGLTLRDQSGFKNNGTLTNGPTWAVNQGRYALNFDGTNDYVQIGAIPNFSNIAQPAVTCSAWVKFASGYAALLTSNFTTGVYWYVAIGALAGGQQVGIGTKYPTYSNAFLTANVWNHVAFTFTGTTIYFFQNGKASGSFAGTADPVCTTFQYGGYGSTESLSGQSDDLRIYNRALSFQEIQLLASRRGIAYEMAPRRRSSAQVTTNRRRRIIIGGNR